MQKKKSWNRFVENLKKIKIIKMIFFKEMLKNNKKNALKLLRKFIVKKINKRYGKFVYVCNEIS